MDALTAFLFGENVGIFFNASSGDILVNAGRQLGELYTNLRGG
jgi:hypothetical protein